MLEPAAYSHFFPLILCTFTEKSQFKGIFHFYSRNFTILLDLHTVRKVMVDFAECDWWRNCRALYDVKFSQIEGNGRNFVTQSEAIASSVKLSNRAETTILSGWLWAFWRDSKIRLVSEFFWELNSSPPILIIFIILPFNAGKFFLYINSGILLASVHTYQPLYSPCTIRTIC